MFVICSRKRWQPGHHICASLHRRFAVPQMYCRSVHVLTNEAVLKGSCHTAVLCKFSMS